MDMAGGWTGRDARALQEALRLSNLRFAEYLGLAARTVADWHAKPNMRPLPDTQRILDTALNQASPAERERFAALTSRPGREGNADEGQSAGGIEDRADRRSAMIGTKGSVLSTYDACGFPEFGRLLLPRLAATRAIKDPKSGEIVAMYADASILFYLIEQFVRVGAIDVAINEGIYGDAIPALPRTFRDRLIEVDRADSAQSVLQIFEPVAKELGAVIGSDGAEINVITHRASMPNPISGALTTLVFNLCDYIRGMRHGLIVALDLLRVREAIETLLEVVTWKESRANLVTIEQVFSTYKSYGIGAPVVKSTAPVRLVEIFDSLTANPLYRDFSHSAANMGAAAESVESVAAVTRAAKRLTDQDDHLDFGRYDAFIASGPHQAASNEISKHFDSKYFPPIVPIRDAFAKAKAAWRRGAPDFIPIGPRLQIDLPSDADLA